MLRPKQKKREKRVDFWFSLISLTVKTAEPIETNELVLKPKIYWAIVVKYNWFNVNFINHMFQSNTFTFYLYWFSSLGLQSFFFVFILVAYWVRVLHLSTVTFREFSLNTLNRTADKFRKCKVFKETPKMSWKTYLSIKKFNNRWRSVQGPCLRGLSKQRYY